MPELEAIGDLAAGSMLSRTVEPKAGEASDGHTHESRCLNCGCDLIGKHCHCCGQHAHVHRTLGAFFHDLAHGVLHFEGKIWRTLPLLAWRPGDLTRRYIDGQRASFVSPIALFLFSVFLMFAVVSATGNLNPNLGDRDLASAERSALKELSSLERKRAQAVERGAATAAIDESIKESRAELALLKDLRSKGVSSAVLSKDLTLKSATPWVERTWRKARQNPDLLIYKLKSNSYKWSWAIIPLSVPFLWLLFPFSRRFRLYDHVVFVTYSLSFMTLLVSIGTLFAAAGADVVAPIMLLIPPVHMYRQLRGAYALGRFGALWRTVGLVVTSIVVLTIFMLLMVTLGAMD